MKHLRKALLKAGLTETPTTKKVKEQRACYLLHLPTGQHVSLVHPPERLWDGSIVRGARDLGVAIFKNPALAGRCRDLLYWNTRKDKWNFRKMQEEAEPKQWSANVCWWPDPERAIGLIYPVHKSLLGKINFEIIHTEEPWNIDHLS